jgi:hypothetical protein
MDETPDEKPDEKRVQSRADALRTEEIEAGSEDPEAQAEAILEESDEREDDRVAPGGKQVESGRSGDNVDPLD